MMKNQQHIPHGAWPRLLSHAEVSAYLGISRQTFDKYLRNRLTEHQIGSRVLWDRCEADALYEIDEDKDEATSSKISKQKALDEL